MPYERLRTIALILAKEGRWRDSKYQAMVAWNLVYMPPLNL